MLNLESPCEVHVLYEETYGKWHCVLHFPQSTGFDFLGPSSYNFWPFMELLESMLMRPLQLKIKPPVRWWQSETETEDETAH